MKSYLYLFQNKIQKSLKWLLNLTIAFQLCLYPVVSSANTIPLTKKERESLNQAENFNQRHVQSLRDFIFNPEESSESYYKNHPLDVFGLLKQAAHYKNSKLLKQEKLLQELESQNKKTQERLEELKNQNPDEMLISSNQIQEERELLEAAIERGEDRLSKQKHKVELLQNKKIKDPIPATKLFVEIFSDTQNADSEEIDIEKKEIQAILSHPSQISAAPLVVNDPSLFKGSVYKNDTKERMSFRLSYKGKLSNSFPQNIEWLAFFDNFIVFLEAGKVSDKKALISFIDLNYFKEAVGRTALPIFHIPVHFQKTKLTKTEVLSPSHLSLTEDKLNIGELALSLEQVSYLSQLQQLSFNVTVSLLDIDTAQMSQKYLKEIVDNFESHAKSSFDLEGKQMQSISLDTKRLVLRILENRRQIGSAKDSAGKYGQHDKLAFNLSLLQEENKIADEFKDNLVADKSFQQAVETTAKQINEQKKSYHRFIIFLNYISRSQPLGAPKIKKALGLIANSVSLKSDNIDNRFLAFKSALSHALYKPTQHRFISSAVLIGAGMLASPEFANYSLIALETMGQWFSNWADLFTITGQSGFEWVNLDGIYNNYLKGDKPFHLMTGLTALFGIGLSFIGATHLVSNFYDFKKHLSSDKGRKHQEKATGLFNPFKNIKNKFIAYMSQSQTAFYHDLSNEEKRKLGIPVHIKLGLNNIESHQLLKTTVNMDSLYSVFESNKRLSLEIKAEKGDQNILLELSSHQKKGQRLTNNQISFSLSHNNKEIRKVFNLSDGNLSQLLDADGLNIDSDLEFKIELSGKDNHISGVLQNADFTAQEHERLNKILADIEMETGKALIHSDEFLSKEKIKRLHQALAHLLIGYSSWAKTFRFLGLGWNWFFLSRSLYISPVTVAKILYYSQYFKTVYAENHRGTVFNGGTENHLSRFISLNQKEVSFNKLKEFESQIINIEKSFLKEVSAQAYLELIKLTGKIPEEINSLSKGSKIQTHEIKNNRLRAFYGIYKRELFQAVIQDYLLDLTDSKDNMSDRKLKLQSLKKFIENENLFKKTPSQTEIRNRVKRVAQEREIRQISIQAVDKLLAGLIKRVVAKSEESSKNSLDPTRNKQMERFELAKKLLNEPEALARATRQQLTYFTLDKPIEVFFTFLFLAGVDQGILQILHDQPFTEEAWFHLSRYAIWSLFFAHLVLDVLAGAWNKVQMDASLDAKKDVMIPSVHDINKKFGYLKWLKKQFTSPNNTFKKHYKDSWNLVIANIPAAFLTITILNFATLGRFDLEIFLNIYLITTFGFLALDWKVERTFEHSVNWSLKELIKQGLDLKEKDKHFLSHPAIQQIKMKESGKLRWYFNLWLALLYENPVGNLLQIFQNTHSSLGSRAFTRMFFGGGMPTEYWVNFMDFLENKQILSSDFAEKCKSIFTNNRTDI